MFPIRSAQMLAPDVKRFSIHAPEIARRRKAGQFVIIRVQEGGERIPLTIVDSDAESGCITLIVQGVGKTTKQMNELHAGDSVLDVVGPLGQPSEIKKYGTAVIIGGGVGTAIAYPTAVALRNAGNETIGIIGARTKDLVLLEYEMRKVVDELLITTDDGSYGWKGVVTAPLKHLIEAGRMPDYVIAIGPVQMMRAVAEVTRPHAIRTVVSLNPVMVDGTGMCGGCRAVVDNRTVFVCVDGPEFDAHLVDFELLQKRNRAYREAEQRALQSFACRTQKPVAELV